MENHNWFFCIQSIIADLGDDDGDDVGDDVFIKGSGSHRTALLLIKYCDRNGAVLTNEEADILFCQG